MTQMVVLAVKIVKIDVNIKSKDASFEDNIMKPQVESIKSKFESLLIIHSSTEEEANRTLDLSIVVLKTALAQVIATTFSS